MFSILKRKNTVVSGLVCSAVILATITGCSTGDTNPKTTDSAKDTPVQSPISTEPVTVKLAASNGQFSQDDFNLYIAEPVKKKYPHITVQRINTSEKGNGLAELLAAGIIPDLVGFYPGNLQIVNELGLSTNIEDLIKKHKFDLTRVAPEAIDAVKAASNKTYLIGLPTYHNPFGLFYNKDLFNKFGVPLPKDGMTWDDAKDLSVKMTRMESGIQYRGLYADFLYRGSRQLSLSPVDFKTNKSLLNTDKWQDIFKLWNSMYEINGLMKDPYKTLDYGKNEESFLKGELAMLAGFSNTLNALKKTSNVNWDVVTYPTNKSAPGIGHRLDSPILSISSQSKVKDAAFLVLETILSDEVQTTMVRNSRMTVLNSQKVKDEFGKGIPEFQGKNMIAMTKGKMASMASVQFLNEGQIDTITNKAFQSVVNKEADINTALRIADEELNKYIDTQLKK